MSLVLPAFDLQHADDAIAVYIGAGLRPILVHAPTAGGGCTCGQDHKATGKHPIAKNWQKQTTLDDLQDQLARLKFKPNVGIVLGAQPSGVYLVAIDVDDEARLLVLEGELGKLPETVRCDSGRGYRLLYELGSEIAIDSVRNVTGLHGEPGVDCKAEGGQIVVAPSVHQNGKRYVWTRVGEIAKLPASWALELVQRTIPEWARDLTPQSIKDDKRTRTRAERYLAKALFDDCASIANVGEGMRNKTLYKCAVALFSLAAGLQLTVKWGDVSRELQDASKRAGLPEREFLKTIVSAETHVRTTGQVRVPVGLTDPGTDPGVGSAGPSVVPSASDPLTLIRLQDDRGSPAKTAGNVAMLLSLHPIWKEGPVFDSYSQTEIWPEPIPDPIANVHRAEREIVDADHAAIQEWLMSMPSSHCVRVGLDVVASGVHLASARKTIDLLVQWVEALPEWDGVPRIDTWTSIYLRCDDTDYARATGRAWLVATIERVFSPGAHVDVAPVLEGPQKSGKNRALETLFAGGPSWAPWLCTVRGDAMDQDENKRIACGRWILHDDEMRARDPKYLDAIKSWHSRMRETYRLPYAREITVAMRRGLLVTSTNLRTYLHDDTGNRRWWPWATGRIDISALERDRLQLLAEALAVLMTGERWRDRITERIYAEALRVADDRRVLDPIVQQLDMLLSTGKFRGVGRPEVLTTQSLGEVLGYGIEKIDRAFETRVGAAMKELGYRTQRETLKDGTRVRKYVPDAMVGQQVAEEVGQKNDQ